MKTTNLYAPNDYWQLSGPKKARFCNGCGTKGLGGILVPDTLYGLSVESACDIHDYMYAQGTKIEHKAEADRVFLNNMLRIINYGTKSGIIKYLRKLRARKYYLAVNVFGGPAFWNGKVTDK